jgi:hypothetical protein
MPKQRNPPDDLGRARTARQRWSQFISARLWPERRAGVLLMRTPVVVQIIGAPIACKEGLKDPLARGRRISSEA